MRSKISLALAFFIFLGTLAVLALPTSPESIVGIPLAVTPTTKPLLPTSPPPENPTPLAEPPLDPPIDVYNFLLLGGDFRDHRIGTEYGDKTDVMLLVSFVMTNPVKIKVIQFPRNFYTDVVSFPDMWLFHVYRREGYAGLHYYFQQVFEVDLHGIAYIHMENFVAFVDGLGGIWVDNAVRDGEAVLAFLRDNDNNWGCPSYDCGERQFRVLKALAEKVKTQFGHSPLATAETLWKAYRGLFETDLSDFEQFHWIIEMGWQIAQSDYYLEFLKVTESDVVVYGNTPLEVRGWIPTDKLDLMGWFDFVLGG